MTTVFHFVNIFVWLQALIILCINLLLKYVLVSGLMVTLIWLKWKAFIDCGESTCITPAFGTNVNVILYFAPVLQKTETTVSPNSAIKKCVFFKGFLNVFQFVPGFREARSNVWQLASKTQRCTILEPTDNHWTPSSAHHSEWMSIIIVMKHYREINDSSPLAFSWMLLCMLETCLLSSRPLVADIRVGSWWVREQS